MHCTGTSASAARRLASATSSASVSTAIDLAPARANATELYQREMPSSTARLPSLTSPHKRSSSSLAAPGPKLMLATTPTSVAARAAVTGDHAARNDPDRVVSGAMTFTVGALRGSDGSRGLVDHRLARRMLIAQVKKGRVPLDQVCDAHPELIRAARNVGTQTSMRCPICEDADLKLVTYVFGPRLSAQGRCVSTAKEMRQLNDRGDELNAYVVEACVECRWNHLLRVIPVGGRS